MEYTSSTNMRASSDAALVVNMARKHRTAIQDALMIDQQLHEWSEPQRTNMQNFFTTMLGVPMSFAQTRVR
jgi:hypothetical protein